MASTASNRQSARNQYIGFLMIHSTLTENMIDHFGARVDGNFKFSKILIKWGYWGHWGHWGHWGCWGSWCQGYHSVCKVQAVFDFFRPKMLLRSLRPVMLSCLMRSLRPLRFSEPLTHLKSISWWLKWPHFHVLKKEFFDSMMKYQVNSALLQNWGCGGQGYYLKPNQRVISQML